MNFWQFYFLILITVVYTRAIPNSVLNAFKQIEINENVNPPVSLPNDPQEEAQIEKRSLVGVEAEPEVNNDQVGVTIQPEVDEQKENTIFKPLVEKRKAALAGVGPEKRDIIPEPVDSVVAEPVLGKREAFESEQQIEGVPELFDEESDLDFEPELHERDITEAAPTKEIPNLEEQLIDI